jgi:hypothetical protein
MMMECLGLSFVNQKVTKIVSNTASIRRLGRRSGIIREVSLRLSLYKTKAQAHRELWIYKFKMARLAAKKKSTGRWKRTKCGWHAKLLKRQQQLLQQDRTRAGRGVLLWPILLGHNSRDPFPNSPLFPRDLSHDRGASPQKECNSAQGGVGQAEGGAQGDNSIQGVCAESSAHQACAESSAHQDKSLPRAEAGASSSSLQNNNPQGACTEAGTSSSAHQEDNSLQEARAEASTSSYSAQQGDNNNSTLSEEGGIREGLGDRASSLAQ